MDFTILQDRILMILFFLLIIIVFIDWGITVDKAAGKPWMEGNPFTAPLLASVSGIVGVTLAIPIIIMVLFLILEYLERRGLGALGYWILASSLFCHILAVLGWLDHYGLPRLVYIDTWIEIYIIAIPLGLVFTMISLFARRK